MQRDGERLPEPERASDQQARVAREEGQGDVGAGRAIHDQGSSRRQQEREDDAAAPLAGRHPYVLREEQHRDQREVGRVENVLVPYAQRELTGDSGDGGENGQARYTRAHQEAKREPGDQRAAWIEGASAGQSRAYELGDERAENDRHRGLGLDLEIQPPDAVAEEARQRGDLVEPRIPAGRRRGGKHPDGRRR